MPGLNHVVTAAEPITLDEFIARLDEQGCDLSSAAGMDRASGLLARLWANRDFLVDLALDELKRDCAGQRGANRYGAQVLLLHRASGRHFVRANFWPAADDPLVRASGRQHYFYDVPHDHNFEFLTIGYLGPGYRSQWYDYDYETVTGYPGEAVTLRHCENGALTPGRMLHYRAHRDVHLQLPPPALSVSLNIVPERPDVMWRDQYLFDIDRSCVAAVPTMAPGEAFLRLAVHHAGGDGVDLAEQFARHHPSERMRWTAWQALAGAAADEDGSRAVIERAASDHSALVSHNAAALLARMERVLAQQ